MYRKLRLIGYQKSNIFVYYDNGQPLDLDNLDGDNSHATGSDVTAAATEAAIRAKISSLCATLDPERNNLFVYTSNHGDDDGALFLWDFDNNGKLDGNEKYSPAELGADTKNCRVCRLFMILDQCFSGAFATIAGDGFHSNTTIYTAAKADESSWDRQYLDAWEDLDVAGLTMNQLHQAVLDSGKIGYGGMYTSTPVKAEGFAGNGDTYLNFCWDEMCHVDWDTAMDPNQSTRDVTFKVCNKSMEPHTYDLAFQGLPQGSSGGQCQIDGPTSFTVLDPTPISIQPLACALVRVRITRPAGLTGKVACYDIMATNRETGNSTSCSGSLYGVSDFGVVRLGDERRALIGRSVAVLFQVTNRTNPTGLFSYEFDTMPSTQGSTERVVSLDGLSPGTRVSRTVQISLGQTATLGVQAHFVAHRPFAFQDVQLFWDFDSNGTKDPVESVGLQSVSDADMQIPTLSGWGMAVLVVLLLLGFLFLQARHAKTKAEAARN